MSFNDTDKYSFFQRDNFSLLSKSNFSSDIFIQEKNKLSLYIKIKYSIKERISTLSIKYANNIFVLSNYCKKEKDLMYGVDSYVNIGAFSNLSFLKSKNKKILKEKKIENIILTVARLDKNKRIDILIQGLSKYLQCNNSKLIVIGDGPELNFLRNLVLKLSLHSKVLFIGPVSDKVLDYYFCNSDCFISIDWADFRLTSYEALLKKCPIVLSIESEFSEELINSGWCTLIEPTVQGVENFFNNYDNSIKNFLDNSLLHNYLKNLTWTNFSIKIFKKMNIIQ
jgi:glycosyltransferase involved in cell wall biosynthesis